MIDDWRLFGNSVAMAVTHHPCIRTCAWML